MSDQQKMDPSTETVATEATTPKKKKTFWQGFLNFLMYGGFFVVLILVLVIAIVISSVFHCK